MEQRIRSVIERYARLNIDAASLDAGADLFQAGMTSHATVSLMLGLENEFDVEFPDRMLARSSFESISTIMSGLQELTEEAAA